VLVILLAYAAVLGLCLAFLETLGPAKDVIVVAALIATVIAIQRSDTDSPRGAKVRE
jgi:hypothetical protein